MLKNRFCVIGLVLGFLVMVGGVSGATTIYVNGSNNGTENGQNWTTGWSTIQEGIDNATAGDTINVSTGTYTENVDVNKSVNLVGAGVSVTTVQAASSSDHVFDVSVNSVNISGLTVKGATGANVAGIYLYSSNYSKIENVNASNNYYGIYLDSSSNNTLTNNNASNNTFFGISLSSSSNNTFTNNIASNNNYEGIYINSSSSNTLTNNIASDNNREGIWMGYSNSR